MINSKNLPPIHHLLNGHDLSWDEKLEKCKMFTCIKEFKNPSSENIIKVWVSNHLK